jgi:hypothetical protein
MPRDLGSPSLRLNVGVGLCVCVLSLLSVGVLGTVTPGTTLTSTTPASAEEMNSCLRPRMETENSTMVLTVPKGQVGP